MCSYSIFFSYYIQEKSFIWTYQTLFENNIRILIYNGDIDNVVSYFGNQRWIESLGLEVWSHGDNWELLKIKSMSQDMLKNKKD